MLTIVTIGSVGSLLLRPLDEQATVRAAVVLAADLTLWVR